jgi:hypothetical protein
VTAHDASSQRRSRSATPSHPVTSSSSTPTEAARSPSRSEAGVCEHEPGYRLISKIFKKNCLSVCLLVSPSVRPSVSRSVVCHSVILSAHQSIVRQSVGPYVGPSVCVYFIRLPSSMPASLALFVEIIRVKTLRFIRRRQAGWQPARQPGRQTDSQADRHVDRHVGRYVDRDADK